MASKDVAAPVGGSKEVAGRSDVTLERLAEIVGGRARKGRRTATIAGIVGLVAGAGLASAGYAIAQAGSDQAERVQVDLTTVAAERRDVTVYTDFAGSLGYEGSATVMAGAAGVVTSVAAEGTDLTRGDAAYAIDSEPVALLYGDLPEWRTLSASSADGPDVLQLETNLAALGYTAGGRMTVDEHFTYYTGVALKAWETAFGISSPDVTFSASEAVFLPGAIRVDSAVTRGTVATRGSQILTGAIVDKVTDTVVGDHEVTSTDSPTQAVTLAVSTSDQSMFSEGLAVEVVLADGTIVPGVVSSVGETPRRLSQGPDSELVVDVVVAVSGDPATLIEGPANVRVTTQTVAGALMVPVRALVALLEGGYAVEVKNADGTTHYVAVTTGVFDSGWVQVTGALSEGDLAVVPG